MNTAPAGLAPARRDRGVSKEKAKGGIGLTEADLQCPICMSLLADPFVTVCGHSFCHTCLSKHLAQRKTCPSCSVYLTLDKCFPNFALQQVLYFSGWFIIHWECNVREAACTSRRNGVSSFQSGSYKWTCGLWQRVAAIFTQAGGGGLKGCCLELKSCRSCWQRALL